MKIPGYQYRARNYGWAQRAITAAEARHGPPEPTCICGRPVPDSRARYGAPCYTCQPAPATDAPAVLHFLDWHDEPACHDRGQVTSTTDPYTVTCKICLTTRALAEELDRRMVNA